MRGYIVSAAVLERRPVTVRRAVSVAEAERQMRPSPSQLYASGVFCGRFELNCSEHMVLNVPGNKAGCRVAAAGREGG